MVLLKTILTKDINLKKLRRASPQLKRLIIELLQREPEDRLGFKNGAEDIMAHEFFEGVDWSAAASKLTEIPFIPQ